VRSTSDGWVFPFPDGLLSDETVDSDAVRAWMAMAMFASADGRAWTKPQTSGSGQLKLVFTWVFIGVGMSRK